MNSACEKAIPQNKVNCFNLRKVNWFNQKTKS